MKTFAQKIKAERKKRGLTQTEMGNLLGVSQRMVLAYETAGRRPHRAKMQEFAEKLELPLAYLAEDQYDSILSVFNGITSAQTEPVPVQEAPASAASLTKKEMEFLRERSTALFAGGELPQESKDAFFQSLYEAYLKCREQASENEMDAMQDEN